MRGSLIGLRCMFDAWTLRQNPTLRIASDIALHGVRTSPTETHPAVNPVVLRSLRAFDSTPPEGTKPRGGHCAVTSGRSRQLSSSNDPLGRNWAANSTNPPGFGPPRRTLRMALSRENVSDQGLREVLGGILSISVMASTTIGRVSVASRRRPQTSAAGEVTASALAHRPCLGLGRFRCSVGSSSGCSELLGDKPGSDSAPVVQEDCPCH